MKKNILTKLVIVAALGYFVDVFDIVLFNIVKKASLADLGISGMNNEISLQNWQQAGLLVGGILWGVIGDKAGRLKVLFGSIIMYSIANLANIFVGSFGSMTFEFYALFRFLAGLGLAGELGGGVTLVSELMDKENRGIGTMIITGVGVFGAIAASLVGKMLAWGWFDWQVVYAIGGTLGLGLLALRAGTFESGMFEKIQIDTSIAKGNLMMLLKPKRLSLYVRTILIGLPIWFMGGIIVPFCIDFSKVIGISAPITVADAILWSYLGLSAGDMLSGYLSQYFRSRKKVMIAFVAGMGIFFGVFFFNRDISFAMFAFEMFLIGLFAGYWAVFVTTASELFGTNIRSTVTSTAPNFVRGLLIPMAMIFVWLKDTLHFDLISSAVILGVCVVIISLLCAFSIEETFGKDLDYIE